MGTISLIVDHCTAIPGVDLDTAYVQTLNPQHVFDKESELEKFLDLQYGKVNVLWGS